jgi:hypothetical protein
MSNFKILSSFSGSWTQNFTPKTFGRNFADLGEFPQISKLLAGTLDEIRPNRKKSPTNFGTKLNCVDSPVFG